MNKLEETNKIMDTIIELEKSGIKVEYTALLGDIAKSLAMIADKLCEVADNGNN